MALPQKSNIRTNINMAEPANNPKYRLALPQASRESKPRPIKPEEDLKYVGGAFHEPDTSTDRSEDKDDCLIGIIPTVGKRWQPCVKAHMTPTVEGETAATTRKEPSRWW